MTFKSTKIFGLLPLYLHSIKPSPKNECHAEQDAEALQRIFEEGGSMMDQQEMMEMMMNKKGTLKPYPFEKFMQGAAMFKQHEMVDGLNFNVSFPLGQQF